MELPFDNELDISIGVIICGHGSRNRLACEDFYFLVEDIREKLPNIPIEYGYLEFSCPTIIQGLDKLRKQSELIPKSFTEIRSKKMNS